MPVYDVTDSKDFGPLITRFLQQFAILIQSQQLYSKDNEHIQDILGKLRNTLNECFEWRNPITLTIIREKLYFEEFPTKSRFPMIMQLIDTLLDRLVRKVNIDSGVEDWELFSFAELLNTSPIELRNIGGPHMMLSVDMGVRNICVSELSVFFSDQVLEIDSWQTTVQKAGLDTEEVSMFMQGPDKQGGLVNMDDDAMVTTRCNRLMNLEVAQLIELLLNPDILAKMILDLSTVETEKGPLIDPAEIIRIITRTENSLLFRSVYSHKKIANRLVKAFKLFDKNVRRAILTEYLRKKANGEIVSNIDLYQFTPEEWADLLLTLFASGDPEKLLGQLVFTREQWDRIRPGLSELYSKQPNAGHSNPDKIEDHFRRLPIHLFDNPVDFDDTSSALDSSVKIPDKKTLDHLNTKMVSHIETGYTHTVLGLLQFETDERHIRKLVNKFYEQVRQMLIRQPLETIIFLSRFQQIMTSKDEKNRGMISEWLSGEGRSFVSEILDSISNLEKSENQDALIRLLPLLKIAGIDTISEMLDKCYFNSKLTGVEVLTTCLQSIRNDVLRVLSGYLDEEMESFSPRRFLKGMNLFIAFTGLNGLSLIKKCVSSKWKSLCMATLIRLVHSDCPDVALPVCREIFHNMKRDPKKLDQEIVAIYGLGVYRDSESLPILHGIAKGSWLWWRRKPPEIRLASLYAIGQIEGPEYLGEIRRQHNKIIRFGVTNLIPTKRRPA